MGSSDEVVVSGAGLGGSLLVEEAVDRPGTVTGLAADAALEVGVKLVLGGVAWSVGAAQEARSKPAVAAMAAPNRPRRRRGAK